MTCNAASLVVETLTVRMHFKRLTQCAAESQRPIFQHPSHFATPQDIQTELSQPTGRKVGGQRVAVRLTLLPPTWLPKMRGVSQTDGLAPLAATAVLFPPYVRHLNNLAAGTPNCSGWEGRLSGAGRGGAPRHFFWGGAEIVVARICHMHNLSKV